VISKPDLVILPAPLACVPVIALALPCTGRQDAAAAIVLAAASSRLLLLLLAAAGTLRIRHDTRHSQHRWEWLFVARCFTL
jgi:hypothetical protein